MIQLLEDQQDNWLLNMSWILEGNPVSSSDPRLGHRKPSKTSKWIYDLTNTVLKTVSVDGGTQWDAAKCDG